MTTTIPTDGTCGAKRTRATAATHPAVRKVTFNLDTTKADIVPTPAPKPAPVKRKAAKATPAPEPVVVTPTPQHQFLYMDFHKQSHLYLGDRDGYRCYLTLYKGTIQVDRLRPESPIVADLKPYTGKDGYPIKRAAKVYLHSMLPKTDEARWVLEQIVNADDNRTDFITGWASPVTVSTKSKRTPKAPKAAKTPAADVVTAVQIAAELKVDGKVLRAALRGGNVTKPGASWTWPVAQRAALVKQFKQLLDTVAKAKA